MPEKRKVLKTNCGVCQCVMYLRPTNHAFSENQNDLYSDELFPHGSVVQASKTGYV
jgi:hypothetical protein